MCRCFEKSTGGGLALCTLRFRHRGGLYLHRIGRWHRRLLTFLFAKGTFLPIPSVGHYKNETKEWLLFVIFRNVNSNRFTVFSWVPSHAFPNVYRKQLLTPPFDRIETKKTNQTNINMTRIEWICNCTHISDSSFVSSAQLFALAMPEPILRDGVSNAAFLRFWKNIIINQRFENGNWNSVSTKYTYIWRQWLWRWFCLGWFCYGCLCFRIVYRVLRKEGKNVQI